MSGNEWIAVAVLVAFGIVLQVPEHDAMNVDAMEGMDHASSMGGMTAATSTDAASPQQTVALEVTGMTQTRCAAAARVAVKRVEGVQEATFSYERGEGLVTYDTSRTSPGDFIAELERMTGFKATVRDDDPGGDAGRTQ